MSRLQSRQTMLWDAMGFSSAKQGWMAALLASFLALFVLVTAVDAAACAPESAATHASEAASDTPSNPDDGGGPSDQHAICSHGHCHHNGVAVPQMPEVAALKATHNDVEPAWATERMASRKPSGPDRPPRS